MANFNRGGGFGAKKRFDNARGDFRAGDRSDRPAMHKAICSECGKECTVPFKPTGSKPVFCSNCFSAKDGGSNNRFDKRGSFNSRRDIKSNFNGKQVFLAICDKCHKECEVPFKPTSDKPIFCNDCFGKEAKGSSNRSGASSEQYVKQFEMLNAKLDSILNLLSPKVATVKKVKDQAPTKKLAVKKVVASKKPVKKVATKKKK